MIATHNQSRAENSSPHSLSENPETVSTAPIQALAKPNTVLPRRALRHHAHSGLNPLVDAAAYLLAVFSQLKSLKSYHQLEKLHAELSQEINALQEGLKTLDYNSEYVLVCRYVLCAIFDDMISNTTWGDKGQWESYSLLAAYSQDTQHEDKFFTILERIIKEPAVYIDLMELMYLCLSLGYKGRYRATLHNQAQLEQITHHLYKRIRAYRGGFSKTLSPASLKNRLTKKTREKFSTPYVLLVTVCVILLLFIGLGYFLDTIANETYQNFAQMEKPLSDEPIRQ